MDRFRVFVPHEGPGGSDSYKAENRRVVARGRGEGLGASVHGGQSSSLGS